MFPIQTVFTEKLLCLKICAAIRLSGTAIPRSGQDRMGLGLLDLGLGRKLGPPPNGCALGTPALTSWAAASLKVGGRWHSSGVLFSPEGVGAVLGATGSEPFGQRGFGNVWLRSRPSPSGGRWRLEGHQARDGQREIIARFEAERQALALMDHPNIARVLDAGTLEQGGPTSCWSWSRATRYHLLLHTRLPLRERSGTLHRCLSGSPSTLHQKAILHRDLKPVEYPGDQVDGKVVPR
jgi:hypothetical protein